MEHDDLTDDLNRRLRAARPAAADVDQHAFDGALLARVRQQPIAPRRSVPRSVAVPVAAGVIVAATAAVVLGGGPDNLGGPPSAAAITQQTLRWLDPPAGTVLHARSIETSGTHTTTREFWQSADEPTAERELVEGAQTFEVSGDALYDPATNTIYDPLGPPPAAGTVPAPGKTGPDPSLPAGDPIVTKVRTLLEQGAMTVTGRELHDGIDTWAISLRPDAGRPVWTMWVSVADGKPVELSDPGRDASEQPQDIRWPVYEVLPGSSAAQLVTLAGAHPSAQIVHDPAQVAAAEQRFNP